MTVLRLYGRQLRPGAVGRWAWILVEHPVDSGWRKTPGPSTHQRCEVTAAIEGLVYLVASGVREVELLSDSRYVVGGMSSTGSKAAPAGRTPPRARVAHRAPQTARQPGIRSDS